MKKLALVSLVAVAAMGGAGIALADDHLERAVVTDSNYLKNRNKVIAIANQRGYQVIDVDVDDYMGRPVLEVEGVKNNQKYDLIFEYPSLRLLVEKLD